MTELLVIALCYFELYSIETGLSNDNNADKANSRRTNELLPRELDPWE